MKLKKGDIVELISLHPKDSHCVNDYYPQLIRCQFKVNYIDKANNTSSKKYIFIQCTLEEKTSSFPKEMTFTFGAVKIRFIKSS